MMYLKVITKFDKKILGNKQTKTLINSLILTIKESWNMIGPKALER